MTSQKTASYSLQIGLIPGSTSITALAANMDLVAGVPYKLRHTFTVPTGYDGQTLGIKFYSGSGVVGDWFDVSDVMVVSSDYQGGFGDGASPGWTWSGTANQSTSSGPSLEP